MGFTRGTYGAIDNDPAGWSSATPSGTWTDGFSASATVNDTMILHVSKSVGNDSNNGSRASPYKTLMKIMTVARSGCPDWVLMKAGDYFDGERLSQYDPSVSLDFGKHGKNEQERFVVATYDPAVLTTFAGRSFATPNPGYPSPLTIIDMAPTSAMSGTDDSRGGRCDGTCTAILGGFRVTYRKSDPYHAEFSGKLQTVTFDISTNVVTFPLGTPQTLSIVQDQKVWFVGANLPAPLQQPNNVPGTSGIGVPAYFLAPFGSSGNQFTIQTTKTVNLRNCQINATGSFTTYMSTGENYGIISSDTPVLPGEAITGAGIAAGTLVASTLPHEGHLSCTSHEGSDILTGCSHFYGVTGLAPGQELWGRLGEGTGLPQGGGAWITQINPSGAGSNTIRINKPIPAGTGANTPQQYYVAGVVIMSQPATGTFFTYPTITPSASSAVDLTTPGTGPFQATLPYGGGAAVSFQAFNSGDGFGMSHFIVEDVEATGTGTTFEAQCGSGDMPNISDVGFRRCRAMDMAQGFHSYGVPNGFFIEESLADVAAWIPGLAWGNGGDSVRQVNTLWHNLYLSADPGNVANLHMDAFRGNIISRVSSNDQIRCGGQVRDNLFIDESSSPFNFGSFEAWAGGYRVAYNTFEATQAGEGGMVGPGWHYSGGPLSVAPVTVDHNIWSFPPTNAGQPIYAYDVTGGAHTYSSNIAWGYLPMYNSSTGANLVVDASNEQWPLCAASPGYASRAGGPYLDPNRTIITYFRDVIGVGTLTRDQIMMTYIRQQRKGKWDSRFTANVINNYRRAGFNQPAYFDSGSAPPPTTTYRTVRLQVT